MSHSKDNFTPLVLSDLTVGSHIRVYNLISRRDVFAGHVVSVSPVDGVPQVTVREEIPTTRSGTRRFPAPAIGLCPNEHGAMSDEQRTYFAVARLEI